MTAEREPDEAWFARNEALFLGNGYSSPPVEFYRVIRAALRTGGDVLELGCGNGLLLRNLVEFSGWDVRAHGIDTNPDLIETARTSVFPARPFAFDVSDARTHVFGRSYNAIVCNPLYVDAGYAHQVDGRIVAYQGGTPVRSYVQRCERALTPGGQLLMFCYLGQADELGWSLSRFLADIDALSCEVLVSIVGRAIVFTRTVPR